MARCVRQHGKITSSLYGPRQASLMLSTSPAPSPRNNLALTRNVPRQHSTILVVNCHAPLAKRTDCWSGDKVPAAASHSSSRSPGRSPSCSSSINQILSPSLLLERQILRLNLLPFRKGRRTSPTKEKYTLCSHLKARTHLPILPFPGASV